MANRYILIRSDFNLLGLGVEGEDGVELREFHALDTDFRDEGREHARVRLDSAPLRHRNN